MHAGVLNPDLHQMISCSWVGGLPTLSLIPHTDPPTFAAAAQAFATLHYPHHHPVSNPANHRQHTSQHTPTTNEDVGQPISRVSTTASKVKAVVADDLSERITRGSAVLEEDCGQQISRSLGNAPSSSSKAAQFSHGQRPLGFPTASARRGTTLDAAELLSGGHRSSSANPAASPTSHDKAHVVPEAVAASQQLHSSPNFFQLPGQSSDLANAPDQSATSLTKPVSQLAAAMVANGGKGLLDNAVVGCLESGTCQEGAPLRRVDSGARARTPQTQTEIPLDPPRPRVGPPQAQAKPRPGLDDAAASSELLVFEDR